METDEQPGSGRYVLAPANTVPRIGVAALAVALLVVVAVVEQGVAVSWQFVAMIVGLGVLPMLAFLALGRPRGNRILDAHDDRLHLPYGPRADQTIVVRYTELTSVYRRRGRRGYLLVATPHAQLTYPEQVFAAPEELDRLYAALRDRVESIVPNGADRLAAMDEANAAADRAADVRPIATVLTLTALALVYVMQHALGGFDRLYAIVSLGAGARPLIDDGQIFRAVTASLLHDNIIHAAIVGFLIFVFGRRMERLFGARNTLLVIVSAMIAGGAVSSISTGEAAFVGAQTAAFGLFGAYAFVVTRYKRTMPHGFANRVGWWVFVGILLATLPMYATVIDLPGELGGALAGVLIAALVLVRTEPKLPRHAVGLPTHVLLGAGLVVMGVAIGFAAQRRAVAGPTDETTMIRYHLDNSLGDRYVLNRLAWEIAVDPNASRERIELARVAIERALERERDDAVIAAFEDTYATILHRDGDREGAVAHELVSLDITDSDFMATQVARFVGDDVVVLSGARDRAATIEVVEHANRGFGVRLQAKTATAASALYAVAEADGEITGLLRLTLPAEVSSQTRWLSKEGAPASWPAGTTLRPAVYAPGIRSWRAWSAASDALALPR